MDATCISLLPPIVVIVVIFFTHRLNISLMLGIASAALLAANGSFLMALCMLKERIIEHFSDMGNIYLYISLISISSLISLLTISGSAIACARIIGSRMRTKRGVETSSIVLSFLLSIDDYLSILTAGFVMRSLTDRFAVSRTKLAYIIHSLAGPLVIIMPISTWAATVLAQLENAGISTQTTAKIMADPFYVYLCTIPFMFYSLITIFSVIFVVRKRVAYGPIYKDEQSAVLMHDVYANENLSNNNEEYSLFDLLLPIAVLIGGVFFGILYAGGFYLFGGSNSFFEAFRCNDKTFFILCISGLGAFIISALRSLYKKRIIITQLPSVVWNGIILMQAPIIMVIFAAILGSFLRTDLHTGSYIAHLLLGKASLFFMPVILFVTSLIITLTTGSAWGTFSLLIPITTEMLIVLLQVQTPTTLDSVAILVPTLGALLSGAVCGDHISPFSETTVMTGASSGINSLIHARTQFYYAFPVICGTLIAFIVAGYMCLGSLSYLSSIISCAVGMGVSLVLLLCANRLL
ncbi:MAG TPA: Na+/H+ antiporter NhaC family protein [Candidatus Babeliales bacterium]|nr:Na+/H+ antiporter NhaC family protein [Candidatus Babeliales bacterium]